MRSKVMRDDTSYRKEFKEKTLKRVNAVLTSIKDEAEEGEDNAVSETNNR